MFPQIDFIKSCYYSTLSLFFHNNRWKGFKGKFDL